MLKTIQMGTPSSARVIPIQCDSKDDAFVFFLARAFWKPEGVAPENML
jgi:hypothetical protein